MIVLLLGTQGPWIEDFDGDEDFSQRLTGFAMIKTMLMQISEPCTVDSI